MTQSKIQRELGLVRKQLEQKNEQLQQKDEEIAKLKRQLEEKGDKGDHRKPKPTPETETSEFEDPTSFRAILGGKTSDSGSSVMAKVIAIARKMNLMKKKNQNRLRR